MKVEPYNNLFPLSIPRINADIPEVGHQEPLTSMCGTR
jgi:hypothetical protein